MTRSTRGRKATPESPLSAKDVEGHTVWPVSTTWRSPSGTIARAPQATQDSRRPTGGVRFRRLPVRNPREPLGVTLIWRGGPEGWCELHARGATVRVPGHTCIAELVLLLNNAH